MGVKRGDSFYKNLLLICLLIDYVVIQMLYLERMFLTCPGYKEKFSVVSESLGIVNEGFIISMFITSLILAVIFIIVYYVFNVVILFFLKSSDVDSYKLIISILISFSVSLLFAFCILSFTPLEPHYLMFKLLVGFSTPFSMAVLFNDAFSVKRDFYMYVVLVLLIGYLVFLTEMQIFRI
jgi:hypothetical protein